MATVLLVSTKFTPLLSNTMFQYFPVTDPLLIVPVLLKFVPKVIWYGVDPLVSN